MRDCITFGFLVYCGVISGAMLSFSVGTIVTDALNIGDSRKF